MVKDKNMGYKRRKKTKDRNPEPKRRNTRRNNTQITPYS